MDVVERIFLIMTFSAAEGFFFIFLRLNKLLTERISPNKKIAIAIKTAFKSQKAHSSPQHFSQKTAFNPKYEGIDIMIVAEPTKSNALICFFILSISFIIAYKNIQKRTVAEWLESAFFDFAGEKFKPVADLEIYFGFGGKSKATSFTSGKTIHVHFLFLHGGDFYFA